METSRVDGVRAARRSVRRRLQYPARFIAGSRYVSKASRKRQIVAVPRHVQELGKQCENATKQLRDMLGTVNSV